MTGTWDCTAEALRQTPMSYSPLVLQRLVNGGEDEANTELCCPPFWCQTRKPHSPVLEEARTRWHCLQRLSKRRVPSERSRRLNRNLRLALERSQQVEARCHPEPVMSIRLNPRIQESVSQLLKASIEDVDAQPRWLLQPTQHLASCSDLSLAARSHRTTAKTKRNGSLEQHGCWTMLLSDSASMSLRT